MGRVQKCKKINKISMLMVIAMTMYTSSHEAEGAWESQVCSWGLQTLCSSPSNFMVVRI